jgi:uncharacterized membrane protein
MTTEATAAQAAPTPLAHLRSRRKPMKNTHQAVIENLSPMNKLALWITDRVGTFGFFLAIFIWTVAWLFWNLFAPTSWRFDPAMGFVLYLFLCNVIQILLMPLIMVGQNLQGLHSEARAQHDLDINVKAEEEIEIILKHLEYQNEILMRMVAKLGVDIHEGLKKP